MGLGRSRAGRGDVHGRYRRTPKVKDVTIEGADAIDHGKLLSGLYHHPPSGILFWRDIARLDRLALELDRRRIESHYHWRGYHAARVGDIEIRYDEDGQALITFEVDPGPPSLLVDFDVEGVPPEVDLSDDLALRTTSLRIGRLVYYDAYEYLLQKIRSRVMAKGYAHATTEGVIESLIGHPAARIWIRADTGPKTTFGRLQIENSSPVPDSAIVNRIAWEEGDVFDPNLIDLTEGRIYQLGLAGSVQFEWPNDDDVVELPMTVRVTPATPRELRIGPGFSRDQVNLELRLMARYRHAGFLHPLNTLRLELRPSLVFRDDLNSEAKPNIEALVALARDDFLLPRVVGSAAVAYRLVQYEAFQPKGLASAWGSLDLSSTIASARRSRPASTTSRWASTRSTRALPRPSSAALVCTASSR
ncbi:MAG: hypothetical protein HC923_09075 [Myxococcales bacterium]|nr:hypothetical protein [Myxococcales bacterium]